MRVFKLCACVIAILAAAPALARKPAAGSDQFVDIHAETWAQVATQIWDWAELGYKEQRSSALLQSHLRDAGFTIQTGVANIPTAFIAEYGQGSPVIGILAFYLLHFSRDHFHLVMLFQINRV